MGKTYPRVSELLKMEFEEKGVTKYAFCKQTGINPTSVERYLCGISEPNQATLEKLSNYFGVSVGWLRGERPERTIKQERLQYKFFGFPTEQTEQIAKELFGDSLELEEESQKLAEVIGWRGSEKVKKYYDLFYNFAKVPNEDIEAVTDALLLIKKIKSIKQQPAEEE